LADFITTAYRFRFLVHAKDSTEVIKFMTSVPEARDWIDDEPVVLEKQAKDDESIRRLCNDLGWVATFLSMNERRQRLEVRRIRSRSAS